jgi:hypothetical protein
MSIHEESTVVAERPMMGVFNNLVIFDQHVAQNSLAAIRPELATGWTWDEEGTRLTFKLREGVKWHDGKPFTAADVKCTWELVQGKTAEKLRVNPRKGWYDNLTEIQTNGDYEVTFVLKRPQPAFLALLASGMSPVYHRRRCERIRSAPARSNSSNSSQTNASRWRKTRIIGRRGCPISTVSNIRSRRTVRPRSLPLSPVNMS